MKKIIKSIVGCILIISISISVGFLLKIDTEVGLFDHLFISTIFGVQLFVAIELIRNNKPE